MKERTLIPGQLYRHFKGNLYQIITIGKHSETGEEMVVYQAMYGEFQVYIRPISMFIEKLDLEKYSDARQEYRFELVKSLYGTDENKEFSEESLNHKRELLSEAKQENTVEAIEERMQNEQVEELYMSFFDAETCKEKLHIMQAIKNDIDLRMLNNIAASMDLPVDEEHLEDVYEMIVKNLEQRSRFECNRFR